MGFTVGYIKEVDPQSGYIVLGLMWREVFCGCFLDFAYEVFRTFIFLAIIKSLQYWAFWVGSAIFVVFVWFEVGFILKIL